MEDITAITAMHHPTRRRIFDYLLLHGTSQVTTISRALGMQVGSVSHHLRMLERGTIVERGEDPTGDRRTSWWRLARHSMTWSADDFADSPADALMAREAERQIIRMQLERLQKWHRMQGRPEFAGYDAFNTELMTWASADELRDLAERVRLMLLDWHASIDREDGTSRTPIFFYARVFPTEP